MQHDAAYELNIIMPLPDGANGRLANNRKSFRQKLQAGTVLHCDTRETSFSYCIKRTVGKGSFLFWQRQRK